MLPGGVFQCLSLFEAGFEVPINHYCSWIHAYNNIKITFNWFYSSISQTFFAAEPLNHVTSPQTNKIHILKVKWGRIYFVKLKSKERLTKTIMYSITKLNPWFEQIFCDFYSLHTVSSILYFSFFGTITRFVLLGTSAITEKIGEQLFSTLPCISVQNGVLCLVQRPPDIHIDRGQHVL